MPTPSIPSSQPDNPHSAFISHSSEDDAMVSAVAKVFRGIGFVVFNDDSSLNAGDPISETCEREVRHCHYFIVIHSRHSAGSIWVTRELKWALAEGKVILPIALDDTPRRPEVVDILHANFAPDVSAAALLSGFDITPPEQKLAPPRFLHHAAEHFLGRDEELAALDAAWEKAGGSTNLFSIIAWGGVGKTALLAHWIQTRFIDGNWKTADGEPNPLRYFDWSFYEQGTVSDEEGEESEEVEARSGSAGDFFAQALMFFGDPDPSAPGQGARLAGLIQEHPSLVVLDGLEPLQYPFNHDQAGRLLNQDMADLLRGLAARNPGLCVVTSRQPLTDLHSLVDGKAPEWRLDDLPIDIAVRHLQKQLAGDLERELLNANEDLREACVEYGQHALSLTLLGHFLNVAHGGDIRRRDCIDLEKADDQTKPGRRRNAWKVLEVYECWLASGEGRPEDLAVLRLTGLFDRPARPDCLEALRREPVIAGLTEAIVGLDEAGWAAVLRRLSGAGLITLRRPADGESNSEDSAFAIPNSSFQVDAHPLIREYFDHQLRRELPEAFREAHRRLFDHLCEATENRPGDLPGLQPLYQAVAHGCLAGRQQEACDKVYRDRIQRGAEAFSTRKLGALGSDLGAVAAFFEEPWERLSPILSEADRAWLLNEAAFRLRALGRLAEAIEPMRVTLEIITRMENWKNAAISASNLSELGVTLGRLGEAVEDGQRAIGFADQSGDGNQKMSKRASAADALHQHGERAKSGALFAEAKGMQTKSQPMYQLLYSVQGFRYVDLLLGEAERAAWRVIGEGLWRISMNEVATSLPNEVLPIFTTSAATEESAMTKYRPCRWGGPGSLRRSRAPCVPDTRMGPKWIQPSLHRFGPAESSTGGALWGDPG